LDFRFHHFSCLYFARRAVTLSTSSGYSLLLRWSWFAMPPPSQCVSSTVEQGVLVLVVTETQLQDEPMADTLLRDMQAAVDHHAAAKVVIDLHNVRYISSVAFRPLLSLRRKMQDAGGRLVLCGLSSVVGDVFYTTRLVSADGSFAAPFEMAPDVPAAIAKLNEK
jgi:anti-anti-sigma factor